MKAAKVPLKTTFGAILKLYRIIFVRHALNVDKKLPVPSVTPGIFDPPKNFPKIAPMLAEITEFTKIDMKDSPFNKPVIADDNPADIPNDTAALPVAAKRAPPTKPPTAEPM